MKLRSILLALVMLAAPGLAAAHAMGGSDHSPMLLHWHAADSGLVLGVPASLLGSAMLALAGLSLAAGVAWFVARRSRPALLTFGSLSAALALTGAGLVAGIV
ncbi:hypothetical protein [Spiribacter onubensis]|uniref:Uncharacterized protein n=1 Tax=Spiribacter onubensis TaxID=3122420 RepID=A0ABV3S9U5_9GAMM